MKQARGIGPRSVIFLRLPIELAEALRDRAKAEGVSIVALLVSILQQWHNAE